MEDADSDFKSDAVSYLGLYRSWHYADGAHVCICVYLLRQVMKAISGGALVSADGEAATSGSEASAVVKTVSSAAAAVVAVETALGERPLTAAASSALSATSASSAVAPVMDAELPTGSSRAPRVGSLKESDLLPVSGVLAAAVAMTVVEEPVLSGPFLEILEMLNSYVRLRRACNSACVVYACATLLCTQHNSSLCSFVVVLMCSVRVV